MIFGVYLIVNHVDEWESIYIYIWFTNRSQFIFFFKVLFVDKKVCYDTSEY